MYRGMQPLWSWLLHENFHPMGIAGHAPGVGINIMGDQAGQALTLNSWDTAILDWQAPGQLYCTSRDALTPTEITLSPLDRTETGTKAAMIRLSDHEVLVVESRRRDHWSSGTINNAGLPEGFYGVTVTRVDTAIDANRRFGDDGFAHYVTNKGVSHASWPTVRLSMDKMLYQGESLISDGVRITLVTTGDHDTIRLERA